MTSLGHPHPSLTHSFPQTPPRLLFHLLSHSASFLRADKGPLIKTAPCPPPVVMSSGDILGENQMASKVLCLPSHAGNLTRRPISPILALLGRAHTPCSLFEGKYSETASLQRLEKVSSSLRLFLDGLSVRVFVGKHLVLLVGPNRTEQTAFIHLSALYASLCYVGEIQF